MTVYDRSTENSGYSTGRYPKIVRHLVHGKPNTKLYIYIHIYIKRFYRERPRFATDFLLQIIDYSSNDNDKIVSVV